MSNNTLSKALSNFLKAFTPAAVDHTVDFADLAHKSIAARPEYVRSGSFYVSEILSPYSCSRRMAFMRAEGCFVDRQAEDPKARLRMDAGSVTHKYVQDELLGPSGALYGDWACASCGTVQVEKSFYPRKVYCPNSVVDHSTYQVVHDHQDAFIPCASRQRRKEKRGEASWHYRELKVRLEELDLSGRVDGVLVDKKAYYEQGASQARWYTVELKSIDDLGFNDKMAITLSAKKYPELAKLYPELVGAQLITESRFKLPKTYHFAQAGIYSEILKIYCDMDQLELSSAMYAGTLVVYVNRENYQMRSFFRRNSKALLEAARSKISAVRHVIGQTDQNERATEEDELQRIDSNRSIVMQLSKSCKTRNDKQALECPWRLICFPYKDASKNKVEIIR